MANLYYTPPRQGSRPSPNYQTGAVWGTDPAVPRAGFEGGANMEWTSSAESAQTAYSHNSSTGATPNTDYAAMPPYKPDPQSFQPNNYTTDTQLANNYGYDTSRNSNTYANHHVQSPMPTRHTPSSLGWKSGTDILKLYSFLVNRGEEPRFELHHKWTPTRSTPLVVHLDNFGSKKGEYRCNYPDGCMKPFSRPADLERHYKNVHASDEYKDCYKCDYPKCGRSADPFTRKDHYRDHLRDYHKEDLGRAKVQKPKGSKGSKGTKDKKKLPPDERPHNQEQWERERVIYPTWWRCTRCLSRMYVEQSGWECPSCKVPCDSDRKERRQKAQEQSKDLPEEQLAGPPATIDYYHGCSTCAGTGWIENMNKGWDGCYVCNSEPNSQDTQVSYFSEETWETTATAPYNSNY